MTIQLDLKRAQFKESLFAGFSEDDGECLRDMQTRVDGTLACFLAGEPDLVPEPLQSATLDYKRMLRREDPVRIEAVARDLVLFKSFLRAKGHAYDMRSQGLVAKAMAFEQTAEWAYKQMSEGFRW